MSGMQSPAQPLALVSMPWAIFNRPSIQLGCLKAYLEQAGDMRVDTYHPYLEIAREIGVEAYSILSDKSWAGEALFAALLFPGQHPEAEAVFRESLGRKQNQLPAYAILVDQLQKACNVWLSDIDWHRYLAAGFSCCFNQLLASLYIAARLKERHPNLPIVFGGSSCSGTLGESLLAHFNQIDYIVDGEGETPLKALYSFLSGQSSALPDRIFARKSTKRVQSAPEIANLNDLPLPDYAHYFRQIKEVYPSLPFIPTLPLEFSRGCWWNKCTFCNLNIQWQKYRWKTAATVVREIDRLTSAYQCLDFTFTDNTLPPKEADIFFDTMAGTDTDHQFFAEIRSITQPDRLRHYRRGGLTTVQVGIEALSASLLEKMVKGCSVIENIAVMKYCLACGIRLEGNLIIEFPGSTAAEVAETLENIDFVLPFHPLSAASFFLGHGSPIQQNPREFGIRALLPHPKNRALFPPEHLQNITLLVGGYRGDRTSQRRLWRPVRKKIAAWNDFHGARKSRTNCPLSYRDGGTFMVIRQERPTNAPLHHRLHGLSRKIYLFCDIIRTFSEIQEKYPELKEPALRTFVTDLCRKRLMYQEHDQVLSLAVQQNRLPITTLERP